MVSAGDILRYDEDEAKYQKKKTLISRSSKSETVFTLEVFSLI